MTFTNYQIALAEVQAGRNTALTLATAMSATQAALVETKRSVGGVDPVMRTTAPSDTEARSQAQGNHGGGTPEGIMELTADETTAMGFARMTGVYVIVTIEALYLTPGSGSEYGFAVRKSAPCIHVRTVPADRRVNLVGAGGRHISAD